MKTFFTTILISLSFFVFSQQPGGGNCSDAAPICTDSIYNFPCQTDTFSESGPDYGCLGSQPNPAWYYLEIATAGDLNLHLTAGSDIDFIIWGPFSDIECDPEQLQDFNEVDCSYLPLNDEYPVINGAHVGQVYMMLITNYSNVPQNFNLTQSDGSGSTDCSIVIPQCSVNAGEDQIVCLNDITTLQATGTVSNIIGNYSFAWSPNGSFINDSTISIIANQSPQSYIVTLTIDGVCEATDTVIVTNFPELTINLTQQDISCYGVCDGISTVNIMTGTPPYTYLWDGFFNGQEIRNLCSGIHNVQVTDLNGCIATGSVNIQSPSEMIYTLDTIINPLCFGDNNGSFVCEVSNGVSPYTYAVNSLSYQTGVFNNLSEGSYYLTITDNNGCILEKTIILTQNTQLVLSETVHDNLCFGDNNGSYYLNTIGGVPPYTYYNDINEVVTDSASLMPSGIYYIKVVDSYNCFTDITLYIDEPTKLVSTINPTYNICYGSSVNLVSSTTGGVSPYTIIWDNNEHTNSITVQPLDTTIYYYNITDNNGCLFGPVFTQVNPTTEIILNVTVSDEIVCPGDYVTINYNIIGGIQPYTVKLDGNIINTDSITVYPTINSIYKIEAVDFCNNMTYENIPLSNYTTPLVSFTSNKINGCQPLIVKFNETINQENIQSYQWNFGNAKYSYEQNPNITFYESGVYDVELIVKTNDGCILSNIYNDMIKVYPLPEARFSFNPHVTDILNNDIEFINNSEGHETSYWFFGDGESSNIENPIHYFMSSDIFKTELKVISHYGCVDSVTNMIYIDDIYRIYIPTDFTPDGDNINDLFIIKGYNISDTNYSFYVYNRWGELIFESHSILKSWDGKFENAYVQNGLYFYILKFNDIATKISHEVSGKITVIR